MLTKSCKSRLIINSLYSLSNGNSHSFCTVSTNMCYYDVLNVRSTATHAEIKSAYYEKVKKFHPDTNTEKGAEEKFKIIAKAYEILKDPNSRQAYDSTKYERAAGTNQSKSQSSYQHNANYYSSYSAEQTRRRYSYGDAWQGYNSSEKHEERTQKSYSQQTQDHSSELKGLLIKVGVVFAVFGLLTMWKSQKKEVSKTQINREVKMLEQEQSKLTMQELQEEMKRKNFRMEHTTVQVYVPPESIEAKKAYKKEKKVTGLESFMEKRNFKLEKSDGY